MYCWRLASSVASSSVVIAARFWPSSSSERALSASSCSAKWPTSTACSSRRWRSSSADRSRSSSALCVSCLCWATWAPSFSAAAFSCLSARPRRRLLAQPVHRRDELVVVPLHLVLPRGVRAHPLLELGAPPQQRLLRAHHRVARAAALGDDLVDALARRRQLLLELLRDQRLARQPVHRVVVLRLEPLALLRLRVVNARRRATAPLRARRATAALRPRGVLAARLRAAAAG